jgi:hypothetical protein
MNRRLVKATLAVLALSLALVPAALAGKGKPGGGGSSTTATLASDCHPCAADTIAHFWGSGYDPSQGVQLRIVASDGTITGAAVPVAADGSVSFGLYMSPAGTYNVQAYQFANGGKLVLKASTSVTAQ